MSCKSLKPTTSIFCLKRNLRNKRTEEYSENLISYLNNARCCETLTVEDLNITSGILSRSLDLMIEGLINNQTESGRQKCLLTLLLPGGLVAPPLVYFVLLFLNG